MLGVLVAATYPERDSHLILIPTTAKPDEVLWWEAPAPLDPRTAEDLPDDDCNGRYADDAGVDSWLPALAEARRDG